MLLNNDSNGEIDAHLSDGRIQQLLSDEISQEMRAESEEHLARCAECRIRVGEAEQAEVQLGELLRTLDDPMPSISAEQMLTVGKSAPVAWRRIAAGIVLAFLAAGGLYAAPGSPIPGWFDSFVANDPVGGADSLDGPVGVAIEVVDSFVVRLGQPQDIETIRVILTAGRQLNVLVENGVAGFRSSPSELYIDNPNPSDVVEVSVPQNASQVDIFLGDTRIFRIREGVVDSDATPDTTGTYHFPG